MDIRPATAADLNRLLDIDATIESNQYLHLEKIGSGLEINFKIEPRPLREKLIQRQPIDDELRFSLKQIVEGIGEGLCLVAEHEETPIALAAAQPVHARGVMEILDIRIDYDFRRQGIATVMMYQIIQAARDAQLRAVTATTLSNNFPAIQFLQKLGFEITGLDTHLRSNHDLVKESAALFWYATLA